MIGEFQEIVLLQLAGQMQAFQQLGYFVNILVLQHLSERENMALSMVEMWCLGEYLVH